MLICGDFEVDYMDMVFIFLDLLGIGVSLAYFRRKQRSSALLTMLLSALLLIKVTWIRAFGGICIVLISICYILFRTQFGSRILKLFGRDSDGRKHKP